MADTAKVVERVADRFVKQITNAFEAALRHGAGRINERQLEAALAGGSRTAATNQALKAVDADDLRVLAKRQPLEDHLLDVAESSANATRCMTRPTVSREVSIQQRSNPASAEAQMHNELSVQQVERHVNAPASLPGVTAQPAPVVRSNVRAAAAADEMVDTVVRIGVRQHGINVYVFTGSGDRISVPSRMRRRLERWSRETGTALHMVAFDRRITDDYSGHDYYYRRGVRSTRLSEMVRVTSGQHLRELVGG